MTINANRVANLSHAAEVTQPFTPGYSLPAHYYLSPACYRHDIAWMRETTWFMAGHESQIPRTGDYRTFTFANENIILIRDKLGTINAFYNVCRHRGSRICIEDKGNAQVLVCPYHAWSYRLDGTLRPPRSMPATFDAAQYALKRCHVRTLEGIIFISLATREAPPDFEEFAGRILAFIEPYALRGTKAVAEERVRSETNWKLPVENFQECYHCPNAHKDLVRILQLNPPEVPVIDEKGETWAKRMERLGRQLDPLNDDESSRHLQMALQQELGGGRVSASMDGTRSSRLLGDLTEYSGGWTLISFNPFAHAVMFDDFVQLIYYTPLDVLKAEATMIYLVRNDAVEGVDYDLTALTELLNRTMTEDKYITDNNQLGISSVAYTPCPLSLEESRVADFHRWYIHNCEAR